jgi:hypothetical protein
MHRGGNVHRTDARTAGEIVIRMDLRAAAKSSTRRHFPPNRRHRLERGPNIIPRGTMVGACQSLREPAVHPRGHDQCDLPALHFVGDFGIDLIQLDI